MTFVKIVSYNRTISSKKKLDQHKFQIHATDGSSTNILKAKQNIWGWVDKSERCNGSYAVLSTIQSVAIRENPNPKVDRHLLTLKQLLCDIHTKESEQFVQFLVKNPSVSFLHSALYGKRISTNSQIISFSYRSTRNCNYLIQKALFTGCI